MFSDPKTVVIHYLVNYTCKSFIKFTPGPKSHAYTVKATAGNSNSEGKRKTVRVSGEFEAVIWVRVIEVLLHWNFSPKYYILIAKSFQGAFNEFDLWSC